MLKKTLVLFLLVSPSFAAVHAVKHVAKTGYKVTKGTAKVAHKVGKFSVRQVF